MAIWDNIKNTYSAFLTQKDGASGASGAPAGSSGTPSGNTYGSWLQNLIGNTKAGVGNAVNTVATAAKNAANNIATAAKNAANNASQVQAATTTGSATEQRQAAYNHAEEQRVAAEQRADVERERGVVDARSSYEQNKASYGANAETMGSMGLAGSGYSDYLNSKAYARQRAETQAANAQADASKREARYTEDQARLTADSAHAQSARVAYTEFLSGANSGAYTAAQLEQLAADYGLSDAQKQSLINAANEYTTNSKEQGQEHVYNSYKDEIAYGSADTGAIDAAHSKGQISEAQYNDLKTRWNNNIDTSSDFFYADNTMLTKSAAQKALNNLTKNSWCSSSVKSALQAEFNKLYTPTVNGSNATASDTELAEAGNNFKVTLNGKNYCVESAGECIDTNVKEVASGVGNGSMFGYQGHVYIKSSGKIYEIRKRKNSYQDDWNIVYAALCG